MARNKVVLPVNADPPGQSMGIVTYNNGTETVAATEVTLVAADGAQIGGDATNGLDVDVTRSALPTGASTAANQATEIASLASIDTKMDALTTPADTQPVSASSLPLPSGASTEATLAGIKTGTDKIPASPAQEHTTAASPAATRLSDGAAFYKATTPSDTQPVSAASLPLPTGASTEATLALIKAKTDNLDVAMSTRTKPADSQNVTGTVTANIGTTNGLALDGTDGTTPPSVLGGGTGIRGWLRSIYEKLTGSIAVTGTFWQGTQPVSGTVTANAGTNLNTSALALDSTVSKDATLTGGTQKSIARGGQKGATNTNADITHTAEGADHEALDVQIYHGGTAKDPTAIRALTSADVVTANAGTNLNTSALALDATLGTTNTEIGGVTETAPATDTASSGLNGRLQRVAQRITSLIALLPASLGQKTKAGSLAVTLASDQDTLPVSLASVPSHAVTNAGTFAVQESGSALTSLQLIDDVVHSGDAALSKYAVMGAVLDDVSTGTVTENQANSLRMSSRRALLVEGVAGATAVKVDNSAVTQPVSGTVTANAGTNLNTSALALDATVGTTNTEIGGLTETAPATDTASSGLNGRLQRIAQRLTSLIALLPASLGQKAMSASLAVTVASDQTAVPASQSGTWTVQPGNTANTTAWKVDGSAVTQPVSGTVTANDVPPTLTKDTQGATGFSVQDLKDAGRSAILAYAQAVAGATSEAIIATFAVSKGFGAVSASSVTSLPNTTVTAGKKFRIQAIIISFISTTTTANSTQIGIRINTGGAAAISSNLAFLFPRIAWETATFIANQGETVTLEIPDGLEIPAGAGVGITHKEAAVNGTIDVSVIGYEY
jgi:hypothetical protein